MELYDFINLLFQVYQYQLYNEATLHIQIFHNRK